MNKTNYSAKTCSFTGYRLKKLNACLAESSLDIHDIKDCLRIRMSEMLEEGFNTFRCGMANGSDLLFARVALELKSKYPSLVRFVAVLPCLEHDRGWQTEERMLCRRIAERADDVVLVSNTRYYNGCMAKRNRYLIEFCDELLAVYDGQHGGTMQTINFAKGANIKTTIIDPTRELIITLLESQIIEKPIISTYIDKQC